MSVSILQICQISETLFWKIDLNLVDFQSFAECSISFMIKLKTMWFIYLIKRLLKVTYIEKLLINSRKKRKQKTNSDTCFVIYCLILYNCFKSQPKKKIKQNRSLINILILPQFYQSFLSLLLSRQYFR